MGLPIRVRLTLVSTLLMALVLTAVGLFIFLRFQTDLMTSVDVGLRSRAEQLAGSLPGGEDLTSAGTVIDPDEAFAQVLGSAGDVIDTSSGIEDVALLDTSGARGLTEPLTFEAMVRTTEETIPARLFAIPTDAGPVVIVGVSLEEQQDALKRLALLSLTGGLVALGLSAVVGWLVAGRALQPVERMRSEAAAISMSDASRRLAVPETADELARLGETLNDLLDRVELTIDRERRFVSDASHELRTPLANLKAELELALRRPREEESLRAALQSAVVETDRLIRLSQDLLVLAGAGKQEMSLDPEPTNLSVLIETETMAISARAAHRDVTIRTDVPADLTFALDQARIRQSMSNLLDNAVRHSPIGGIVTVRAWSSEGELVVEVEDTGDGFPEGFAMVAFEPFSRADAGRTRTDGGSGLGLAIVRSIVEAHGGTVSAANRTDGGGVVTMRLPV